jgi:flagellar hook-associated protein 1 FlgK
MPGLFQALELGKRALLTQQTYLQTIGHNIANVNTPGYSRQRVRIVPTLPEQNTLGSIGTGVRVGDIRQVRDLFLGQQYRQENKSLGQWTYKEKILSQIEVFFSEPNDNTLSDLLNGFWDAWSDLSTDPASTNHRIALIEQTNRLTSGFHELAKRLNNLRDSIDKDLVIMVDDINQLTADIARLNGKIKLSELGGERANDLRDMRDRLLDELSELIDVNVIEQSTGEVLVFMGALAIVDGVNTMRLGTEVSESGGTVTHRVVWEGTQTEIRNANGKLKGLLDARDEIVPRYQQELNRLAQELVTQVNTLHRSGYGLDGQSGRDFFDASYTDAATIRINAAIAENPERIAASSGGEVGDNTLALAIHELRELRVMENDTTTMNDFYVSIIGKLGAESLQAQSFSENYTLLVHQIENARQSVQGVSLDEEMTNMVKSQHAYDAAARVITAMDQALDVVIFRMGITGR